MSSQNHEKQRQKKREAEETDGEHETGTQESHGLFHTLFAGAGRCQSRNPVSYPGERWASYSSRGEVGRAWSRAWMDGWEVRRALEEEHDAPPS